MALPIIATSFFVHQDFHLWMIFLVLPTTVFAVFMGCRNHKDRMVLALSAIGLSILLFALIQERVCYASEGDVAVSSADCETCARDLSVEPIPTQAGAWLNAIGGIFGECPHSKFPTVSQGQLLSRSRLGVILSGAAFALTTDAVYFH